MDLTTKIIEYETGNLSNRGILELFSELIKTGYCWNLQGSYGRTAKTLIDRNIIDKTGKILIPLERIDD